MAPAVPILRTVFDYRQAHWIAIKADLSIVNWSLIHNLGLTVAEHHFCEKVHEILLRYIPRKQITERKVGTALGKQ